MTTYQQLLNTPEWDDKRKIILKRDNYTCQECGAKDCILQVHHHYYNMGWNPWEYDDEVLITLCEACHEREEYLKNFDMMAWRYLLTNGLTRNKLQRLVTAISKSINHPDKDAVNEFEQVIKRVYGER